MRPLYAALCAVFFVSVSLVVPSRADVVIGVYSDEIGNCSFSGNTPGLVTAHVIVRPDGTGVRGVRFKAPIPSCFDASFVAETVPEGMFSIGDSQTGISITFPECITVPTKVLDITFNTGGGTTPCCEFELVADPLVGSLEALDCSYNGIPLQSITSYMNADSTCACSAPHAPPNPPHTPTPSNGAPAVWRDLTLQWRCTDPEGLAITCDVYFGTTSNPPLVATGIAGDTYFSHTLPRLMPDVPYYWQVVAHNAGGRETTGPLWMFTSGPNVPPSVGLLLPAGGAVTQPVMNTLTWAGYDDYASLTYDVYLGTDPQSLPQVVAGISDETFTTPALAWQTTYYWRVTVHDLDGAQATSLTRSFTTRAEDEPPHLLQPPNGAINQPASSTLKWVGFDDAPVTYDVYLGTDPQSLPKIVDATSLTEYTTPPLAFETTYHWRVVSKNAGGEERTSETWHFTTRPENLPPSVPRQPYPANNTAGVNPANVFLSWQCTDPDGGALAYDVYLGTTANPPLVASNHPVSYYYSQTALEVETRYYWRVVARDPGGLTATGPSWTFTTRANQPPSVPQYPAPSHDATGVPLDATLAWYGSDPDAQSLVYDVYFGTGTPPPLVASNVPASSYDPGPLVYLTKYYWRIVARDPFGLEASGPVWSFTSKLENEPPSAPFDPLPWDTATDQPVNTTLAWTAVDPEGAALTFDVYFGTDPSPPLVADHVPDASHNPGPLAPLTTYYWRVVSRDPTGLETSGSVWSFTTFSTTNVPPNVPSNPNPPENAVTTTLPLLSWNGGDPDGDPVEYYLFMYNDMGDYRWWTTTEAFFQVPDPLVPGTYHWVVGAYDGYWYKESPYWSFRVSDMVPVAFSSFTALQAGIAVDIRWELASDEAMEGFTLYRRQKDRESVEIARGRVEDVKGSYRDTGVEPGKTYQYELVVHTANGSDFRSQLATVSMAKLELALHQNVPNPFNPQTSIGYDLPAPGRVRLTIFDVNGRLVRTLVDEDRPAGPHEATWTGRDDAGTPVSSGVYFYVLDAGKQRLTRKLVLLK